MVLCKDVEELVKASDIICTATPATAPLLPDDAEMLRGKCIIAVGSYTPEMREIPDAIWDLVDNVYIELPYALEESGDLSQPLEAGRLKKENAVLMVKIKAKITNQSLLTKLVRRWERGLSGLRRVLRWHSLHLQR